MFDILQNSTGTPLPFLMISTSDHITGSTGATVVALLRKNTGAFATASGAVSEVGYGWYQVAGNANDTNTLGPVLLHGTAAGCDPTDIQVARVVAYNPDSATVVLSTGTHTGAVIPTVNVVSTSNDGRMANLDLNIGAVNTSVLTRATAGDAMTLTGGERTTLATVIGTSSQAESYRANGAGGSIAQLLYEAAGHLSEATIVGTGKTVKKTDHATTAMTFNLDNSTAPTSITRAS